jgi:hypothetical protein
VGGGPLVTEDEVLAVAEALRPARRGEWRRCELFWADPTSDRLRPLCILLDVGHWGVGDVHRRIVHEQIEKTEGEYLGVIHFVLPSVMDGGTDGS